MKTVSIREVRHVRHKRARIKMPDVSARLKKVFGRKMISDKTMREILDDNRRNY